MERYCKNCRWCKYVPKFPDESECIHPDVSGLIVQTDPVTGESFTYGQATNYCEAMRGAKGRCGPDAKYFEPKTKPKPTLKIEEPEISEEKSSRFSLISLKNWVMIKLSEFPIVF